MIQTTPDGTGLDWRPAAPGDDFGDLYYFMQASETDAFGNITRFIGIVVSPGDAVVDTAAQDGVIGRAGF